MSAVISEAELREWMQFFTLEPFGSEVEFYRFGIIASVLANVNRDPKKRGKPFTPVDFIPTPKADKARRDKEAMKPENVKASFLEAFGDRVKRG